MAILHGSDFFASSPYPVAIEPREPQSSFPEHHHDFHEIVIVEQGAGTHVLNGRPQRLCSGCVCFIRDYDRHLYEQTENLHLTNVLYRGPNAFRFLAGLEQLLPQAGNEQSQPHWRINNKLLTQVQVIIQRLEQTPATFSLEHLAQQELLFMQLLVLLRQGGITASIDDQEGRLRRLLDWLAENYSDEIKWDELADRFSLPLRTLHRQMKKQTGNTPQRYLNRLRLLQARQMLRQDETRITDIAYQCGFGDSNHFSTLFKREFGYSPRTLRQNDFLT
ncbi:HTH-type transcriptional activator RhaS [Serratia sp. BIGb0163]|uniref:HTH-type transcriptional activator RhaS n=1 Tax=Serratia sp. BIGb0163 TaxID=2940613 RepID=UPI002169CD77|nr:HTH-type transcriptional activator RhaS [Serratia sp. BIGb0163]MCS4265188.1 AraC family L-rhamnose operon regulatory protein RhaS [Serratia sp. BIGb0163]